MSPAARCFSSRRPIRNVGQFGAHRMLPPEQAAKRLGGERFRLAGQLRHHQPQVRLGRHPRREALSGEDALFHQLQSAHDPGQRPGGLPGPGEGGFHGRVRFLPHPHGRAGRHRAAGGHLAGDGLHRRFLEAPRLAPPPAQGDPGRRVPLGPRDAQRPGPPRRPGRALVGQLRGGLDWILEPMGITWQDFKKMDYIRGEVRYEKYEREGFSTPTRKFELYSTLLEKWGYDPLPQYREPPESPVSTPELHRDIPLHPDHRRPAAGVLPHRKPPAPLAAGAAPGPDGRDPSGDGRQGGHSRRGLGGHRIAAGKGPAAGQTLRRAWTRGSSPPSTPGGSRKRRTPATAGTSRTSTS